VTGGGRPGRHRRSPGPTVHIVIVNWNTRGYLRECLESIVVNQTDEVTLERVTIVDNASSDGSADGLDGLVLPIEVVRNSSNVGFARACNQGAAASTADYLLFLNPDTQVLAGALSAVIGFMESEDAAAIGICGARVVDADGNPAISCARFPTLRVMLGKVTGLHSVVPALFPGHHLTPAELTRSRVVDQVIGAFYCVRSELFRELGGFDERYFLYFEEVDLALRARDRGARSYYLSAACIVHAANVSSDQVHDLRIYHSLRSRLLFARRHWPGWQWLVLVVVTLTVEPLARVARAMARRDGSELVYTARGYQMLIRELYGWAHEGFPVGAPDARPAKHAASRPLG